MNTEGTTYEATLETTKPRRWPWIVGIVAALFAGLVVGVAAAAPAPTVAAEPEPAVTVTAEPEVVTETVEVTPAICIEALDEAVNGFSETVELLDVIIEWHDELIAILDRDGYLITAEWNDLDAEYAPLIPTITEASGAATACRLLAEG